MKRPFAITLAAAILGLIAVAELFLAAAVLLFVELGLQGGIYFGSPPRPGWLDKGALSVAVLLLVFVAWEVTTMVGLLRVRRWARASMLYFSSLHSLSLCIALALAIYEGAKLSIFRSASHPLLSSARDASTAPLVLVCAVVVFLGGWSIFYFNHRTVKNAFTEGNRIEAGAAHP